MGLRGVGVGTIVLGVVAAIAVAFGMVIGAAILGKTQTVSESMQLTTKANSTIGSMFTTVWGALPLLPLAVLAIIGGIVISAIFVFFAWGRR